MSQNYLRFNDVDCRDYGVYITGSGVHNAPERSYEFVEVPGRSGDLLNNERRLKNLELTYPAFIYTNFKTAHQAFRSFLLSQIGYKKLWDSYYPDEYRWATYYEEMTVEPTEKGEAGSFDLVFYCKPQRYLLSGEDVTTMTTSGGTIMNPTVFNSLPLLRVYGTGYLYIGESQLQITAADTYTDIDSETMECFKGAVSKNENVKLAGHRFPELVPGSNTVTFSSGITKVEITPRWWRL